MRYFEKKKKLTDSVEDLKIPGRKRKTRREYRTMDRKSMSEYYKTAPEKKAKTQLEHGVNGSTSSTIRRQRETGLIGRKLRKEPRRTSRKKKAPRTHKHCTPEQWSHVIGLHSHLISIQSKIFGTRLRQWSRNKIQQVLKNCGLL